MQEAEKEQGKKYKVGGAAKSPTQDHNKGGYDGGNAGGTREIGEAVQEEVGGQE